ncbi:hypothetical protein PL321_10175 [Caloramator sp. mosi_1]|uniref:hypothetical protein n=1 Tax=Caloramator sp. mosi_1 TaxID=3023090 RepID=UPI0023623F5E|nr:hypothetical protein [Caloramator sp. mosi_1]WDC83186.1 hypothetical protein PL321_10175 [Caloramator sp. mosi_1]
MDGISKIINIAKLNLDKEKKIELYKNRLKDLFEASFVNIHKAETQYFKDDLFEFTLSKVIEEKGIKVFIETIKQHNSFLIRENILVPIIKNEAVEYVLHIVFDNQKLLLLHQDYNALSTIAQIYLLMV